MGPYTEGDPSHGEYIIYGDHDVKVQKYRLRAIESKSPDQHKRLRKA